MITFGDCAVFAVSTFVSVFAAWIVGEAWWRWRRARRERDRW